MLSHPLPASIITDSKTQRPNWCSAGVQPKSLIFKLSLYFGASLRSMLNRKTHENRRLLKEKGRSLFALSSLVGRNHLGELPSRPVEGSWQLGVSKVHVEESETNAVAVGPLKVVHQRPGEISTDVDPVLVYRCRRKKRSLRTPLLAPKPSNIRLARRWRQKATKNLLKAASIHCSSEEGTYL